jgi:hypothetical protein
MCDYEKYLRDKLLLLTGSKNSKKTSSFSSSPSSSSSSPSPSLLHHPDFPSIPCLEYFFPPSSYKNMSASSSSSSSSFPSRFKNKTHKKNNDDNLNEHPPFLPFMIPTEDVVVQVKSAILAG